MSGGFVMANTLFVEDSNAGKEKWRKPLRIATWTIVGLALSGAVVAIYHYIIAPLIG